MFTDPQQINYSSYAISRHVLCSLLLLLTLSLLAGQVTAQNEKDMPALELGKPIERELAGDAAHSYRIVLAPNQFLHLVVEQKGIDVVVALFAPDGKKIAEVDSPNGTLSPEPLFFIAEIAGTHRLEIRSLEKAALAARYQVEVVELRDATARDQKRMQAEALISEADHLKQLGEAAARHQAIDKYRAAVPLWQAVSDRKKEAHTILSVGQTQYALGQLTNAIESYNLALLLFRALNDLVGEANALNDMGIAHSSLGDMPKSVELYSQALVLFRKAGDKQGEGGALNNLAGIQWDIGDFDKALEFYLQALPLTRSIKDVQAEASVLGNIGEAYRSLGEYQRAFDYYEQSLKPTRAIKDHSGEAYLLDNMGSLYSSLGDFQTALPYLTRGLEIRRRIGDQVGEEISLNNLGSLYRRRRDFTKALEYYNQGLILARNIHSPETAELANLGGTYLDLNEPSKAIAYYQQALALAIKVNSHPFEAKSLSGLGESYLAAGEIQKAADYSNQALQLSRSVKDRKLEASTHYHLARCASKSGDIMGALPRIEEALALVESVRTKIGGYELRSAYFATVQGYYEFYIDLLMQLHKRQPAAGYESEALQASERQRARSLLEILAEANADIRQGIDLPLAAGEVSLQQQLNTKAQLQMRLLSGPHSDEQALTIAREIESLTTELQQVEARIRQTSPRYAALTQPTPLTLKEIQTQVLDEDTLLLEYSLGKDRSYLWAVTPTSITSFELPKRDEIEALARQVYAQLTTDRKRETKTSAGQRELKRENAEAGSGPEAALRLSKMLLGPIASQLGTKRLLVVADGALQYIPFGALPVPIGSGPTAVSEITRKKKSTTNKYRPLVVEHEIVSLPSASTLAVLRKEVKDRKPAEKTVAILADPVFESDDERVRQALKTPVGAPNNLPVAKSRELPLGMERAAIESGLKGARLTIPRLPATRDEARQILSLVPPAQSKGSFDFDASRQTATSRELSQYRYVHFATHGFLDSLHPELSGIVLSMVDEKGNQQDGFLRAHEIFNLKLPAELVVLSACQTGLGKEVKGEGLVSLTRGFMYAGAARVVVSLWSVNDEATAELMSRFYRGMLKDNLRPAAALRAAQISLMKERAWPSPFYWAAFTIQGEWR